MWLNMNRKVRENIGGKKALAPILNEIMSICCPYYDHSFHSNDKVRTRSIQDSKEEKHKISSNLLV